MELWIRSQNKLRLVKNPNLCIDNEFVDEYTINGLSNDRYLKLASYKTKERALEVLDEIQKLLEPKVETKLKGKIVFDGNGDAKSVLVPYEDITRVEQLSTCIYQMPKE